jgi:hypothetical protein
MEFDADVEAAIEKDVPLFFRKMARNGLVQFATEKKVDRVTMAIYLEAKAKYLASQKPPTA